MERECATCGKPVDALAAYSDGKGNGPWHRLCIPPHPEHLERRIASVALEEEIRAQGNLQWRSANRQSWNGSS